MQFRKSSTGELKRKGKAPDCPSDFHFLQHCRIPLENGELIQTFEPILLDFLHQFGLDFGEKRVFREYDIKMPLRENYRSTGQDGYQCGCQSLSGLRILDSRQRCY